MNQTTQTSNITDVQWTAVRDTLALYEREIVPTPRSPEWKEGARAGIQSAYGLPFDRSSWRAGTAQDDARTAGYHVGWALAREQQKVAA